MATSFWRCLKTHLTTWVRFRSCEFRSKIHANDNGDHEKVCRYSDEHSPQI